MRWDKNYDKKDYNNSIVYKETIFNRRDLYETINYYNAYWSLEVLKTYFDRYATKCKNRGKDPEDGRHLNYKLNLFLIFLYEEKNDKELSQVTEEDMEENLLYIRKEKKLKQVAIYIAFAKKLFDYLIEFGQINFNPVGKLARTIKKDEKEVYSTNIFTDEQIEIAKTKLPEHLKMYMLFSMSTGIKYYQLVNLKWSDIDFEKRVITLDETLYMNQEVSDILENEKNRRILEKKNDYGYVFRSDVDQYFEKDAPISKTTIGRWCNDIGAILGIENVRHLDFRHMAIRKLLSASGSAGMTSLILNHPYLISTARYFSDPNVNNELLQEYKDICEI